MREWCAKNNMYCEDVRDLSERFSVDCDEGLACDDCDERVARAISMDRDMKIRDIVENDAELYEAYLTNPWFYKSVNSIARGFNKYKVVTQLANLVFDNNGQIYSLPDNMAIKLILKMCKSIDAESKKEIERIKKGGC